MKFHLFYALGWNHCCSISFVGPKWVKVAGRALKIKKINNFTKNQKFQKILIIGEIYEIYWFSWFRPQKPAPGFCFPLFGASGENGRIFMIFLIFCEKNYFLWWKMKKSGNFTGGWKRLLFLTFLLGNLGDFG